MDRTEQIDRKSTKIINITLPIPMELQTADELLTSYGRWAMNRWSKRRCASAEGSYATPPNDDDRTPREVLPNDMDAMRVQRALAGVPELQRNVLAILYIPQRLPPHAQLRMKHIPPRLCQERHQEGLRMFWNRYRLHVS